MADLPQVRIHYRRPPEREDLFVQTLVLDTPEVKVSYAAPMTFDPPVVVRDRIVLETGSEVVWFTFPGEWHDIGRFHTADGTFQGYYANILTPPVIVQTDAGDQEWHTTDLFLDVWLDPDGFLTLLDEDQLDEAVTRGWLDAGSAGAARGEAHRILSEAAAGSWPPKVVEEWPLERAREVAR